MYTIKLNFKLDDFFKEMRGKSYCYYSLFFSSIVVEQDGILFKVHSLLVQHISIKLWVLVYVLVIIIFPLRVKCILMCCTSREWTLNNIPSCSTTILLKNKL
jgi:hypothetical protein